MGPNLFDIVGREIASSPGYDYSSGLETLSGAWTEERLDRFLEDPEAYAPGTSMESAGILDPVTRAGLIEYLVAQR